MFAYAGTALLLLLVVSLYDRSLVDLLGTDEIATEVVRSLMLLRLATLATGHTGVRVETVEAYVAWCNSEYLPVVHEFGSLGCSGDLAPLSHVALAVMGEGPVAAADGTVHPASVAGIPPVTLAEKEGLALINGTDGMLGQLLLAMPAQHRNGALIQGDGTPAACSRSISASSKPC